MRGSDRAAGAVAAIERSKHPILAARTVLDHSPHVLMVGARNAGTDLSFPASESAAKYGASVEVEMIFQLKQ